jgi:imidazolonepropionase-like amidohydrolase
MSVYVFKDATLLDCTGNDPVYPAYVITEDDYIKEVGSGTPKAIPPDADVVDCKGMTLMPGLIDAHIHLGLFDRDLGEQPRRYYPSMQVVKALGVLEDTLMQGFTTCREAGGVDAGFREAVAQGLVKGPRLTISGMSLTQTGGHADPRLSTEIRDPFDAILGVGMVCDGVAEVRRGAREQLRRGVDHIKVMAGGGCASPADEPDTSQYSLEELSAIVFEAASAGKYAFAHCYSNRSMQLCAKAGMKSIEHGNFLDEETAKILKESGCWYVPTLATYDIMVKRGEEFGIPPYFLRKMKQVQEHSLQAVENAKKAGVPMGSGADVVGPGTPYKGLELELKARVLGPMEAILSATKMNSKLMEMENQVGTVEEGKYADLLLVDGDPLEDIKVFQDRDKLVMIMQQGKFVKRT